MGDFDNKEQFSLHMTDNTDMNPDTFLRIFDILYSCKKISSQLI